MLDVSINHRNTRRRTRRGACARSRFSSMITSTENLSARNEKLDEKARKLPVEVTELLRPG